MSPAFLRNLRAAILCHDYSWLFVSVNPLTVVGIIGASPLFMKAADENLAVTLGFLATGESYESWMYQFCIHGTAIGRFIPQVSRAIYAALKDEYLKVPSTEQEWEFIADETFKRWNFPNPFAAADSKHITLFHLEGSGSEYYNYKDFYSLVLLAFVDYDYKFLLIDVQCQERISDRGVFSNSAICSVINNDFNLPELRPLPFLDDENDMLCYDKTPVCR